MFNSKFPIVALAMTHVSDARFAVACANAGIFPSIAISCYYKGHQLDYLALMSGILEFKQARKNTDFMFSMWEEHLHDVLLIKFLKAAKIKFLEVTMPWKDYDIDKCKAALEALRKDGFVIFQRANQYDTRVERPARNGALFPYFDGVILKGSNGAGVVTNQSLEEMFFVAKRDYPEKFLIASGGIGNKSQIDFFVNHGAVAVGIGTLFAVSQESPLSLETKNKMIEADFKKVKETTYAERNALVFRPVKTEDPSYTASLRLGILRPDIGGHVFAGAAIDKIKTIASLEQVVNQLVQENG